MEDCAVGDFCNRLFIDEAGGPVPQQEKLRTLVEEINRHLICIPDDFLERVDSVLVVAGGVQKARGIRFALKEKQMRRVLLFTDSKCAEKILNMEARTNSP